MVIEKSCCLLLLAFVASCCELLREYELSRMKRLLGLTIVLLVWPLLNNISAIRWFQILPRKKGLWAKINFSTMSPKNKSVQPKKSVLGSKSNLLWTVNWSILIGWRSTPIRWRLTISFDVNLNQDKAISKTWLYDVSIIAAQMGYE